MVTVDLVWLWLGDFIRKAELNRITERALNIAMDTTIFLTAVLTYIWTTLETCNFSSPIGA